MMLLLSARVCSATAKRNSDCLEITFDRSSSLNDNSLLICVANRLGARFVQIFGRDVRESAETVHF